MTFEQSIAKIDQTLRSYLAEVERLTPQVDLLLAENARLRASNSELVAAAKVGLDALSDFDASDLEMVSDLVTSMQDGMIALQAAIAKAEEPAP